MPSLKAAAAWLALVLVISVPLTVAAASPLLAWRQPVYIAAGFAGAVSMALLVVQPLLAGGYLPGLSGLRGRRVHRFMGAALVLAVALHVAGLWLTSPPDVVDALLFTSPTPFSAWGVIAMWAAFAAALLAALRHRLGPRVWRLGHMSAVAIVVATGVIHAMLIEGTMGTLSKAALCACAIAATLKVMTGLRVWRLLPRRRRETRRGKPNERH